MDFSSRGAQPAANPVQPVGGSPAARHNNKGTNETKETWFRVGIIGAIVAIVVLLIALIVFISANNSSLKDTENSYINKGKLQAVFLNTGQVYFGNVSELNNQFLVLKNIYYLQTSSNGSSSAATTSSSNTNVTLVKLGCELHMPYDQMVINRSQVTFWENLQSNGQVAKAVASWEQQHPNGQQCSDQSSSASTTSGKATQNAGTATKP